MDASQKSILTVVVISAVVIGAVFLYFLLIIYRLQRRHLRHQSALVLSEMRLLEEERTRIAHDLHDGQGPLLLMLHVCLQQAKGATAADNETLAKAAGHLYNLQKESRRLLYNLTPRTLHSRGLGTALQDFLEQCTETIGLRFQLRYQVAALLPPDVSIHLFRMVQELVNNAHKHGRATYLELELTEQKSWLLLRFRDNGCGFDTTAAYEGTGLQSLRGRTRRLGGSMQCRSAVGANTEYLFTIPLQHNYEPY